MSTSGSGQPENHSPPGLRELFDAALALDEPERTRFVDAQEMDAATRARLEQMLAANSDPSRSAHTGVAAEDTQGPVQNALSRWPPGTRIGPFVLAEALGEGGFATVFRAWRENDGVRQQVALKLLHRGLHSPEAQRRFRHERQALSQLRHPNIAQFIEGGVTAEGVAYIALELVEGEPITRFAEGLDQPRRLRLFMQICRAVEAAHRALIVHRDLKPSNVMVSTDGQVKLLDFGVAKLLDQDTDESRTQAPAFTPAYAAPEQREHGPITTATDVYALGVLLGEILTGHRLLASTMRQSGLRSDLERILGKALATDAALRYPSAGALADDIQRFLDGQPVLAHPPTRRYRFSKFVQRHRLGVALGSLLAMGILVSLAVAVWQAGVARQEALRANTVRDFLVSVFDAARAHLPREQRPTPEQLVDHAQARLAATPLDDTTRAEVLRTLGEVDLSLAHFARAEASFAKAIALLGEDADPAAMQAIQILRADALQRAGNNAEAQSLLAPVLPTLRDNTPDALLRALPVLAAASMAQGEPDEALAYLRENAERAELRYGPAHPEALAAAFAVGKALVDAHRFTDAVELLDTELARWKDSGLPEDERYVDALASRTAAGEALGDTAGAVARQQQLLELRQRIFEAPHDSIARNLRDLGAAHMHGADYPAAEARMNEALQMLREVYGDAHEQIAITHDSLGHLYVLQRDFVRADANYTAALDVCARAKIRSEVCPRARNNLGQSLYRQQRTDQARTEMRRALDERKELFGPDHPTVAYSLSTLANVAAREGDAQESVELSEQAMAVLERNQLGASREAALARNSYAQALMLSGRHEDALAQIERSIVDWKRVVPDGKVREAMMRVLEAQILQELGRREAVREVITQVRALQVPDTALPERTVALIVELDAWSRAESAADK
jgi:Tfp pilus assembly protein PilF